MVGLGTLMNVGTVILGGALGLLLGSRLPERMRETIMHGLGLLTMVIGIQLSLETGSILIVLGSLLMGGVFGEWLQIERRLEQLGSWVQSRTVRGASSQEPNASDPGWTDGRLHIADSQIGSGWIRWVGLRIDYGTRRDPVCADRLGLPGRSDARRWLGERCSD